MNVASVTGVTPVHDRLARFDRFGAAEGVSSLGGRTFLAGALAACAMVGGGRDGLAFGQSNAAPTAAESNLPTVSFAIPAGPLDQALKGYEAATGLKVKTGISGDKLAGFTTAGLTGTYPEAEGLRVLLVGTGLQYRLDGKTMVVGMQAREDVTVQADATMPLGQFTEALKDTPQSVTVVPQFIMKEQAITTLRDSLRNVPGISLAAGEAGAQGDNLTIRGFTARNDIFLDGIRDFGSYYRDSFNYEQVEVLEGPAGIEFGRGSTGGVINQESKRPLDHKLVSGAVQLGTNLTRRVTVDVNQPVGEIGGGGAAFRMNIMGDEANVAGRDVVENRRFGVAPSLSFGMGTKSRATLSYVHQGENDIPDYGIPWLLDGPSPAKRSAYYGFRHGNFINTHDDILTLRLDHDVNEHASFRSITRFANYPRNAQITEPQVCSNGAISPTTGLLLAPTNVLNSAQLCPYNNGAPSDPSTILVNRNQITVASVENDLWQQDEALLHFRFLNIAQAVVVGVEGGREMSNPTRFTFTGVPTATLLNPNEDLPFAGTKTLSTRTHLAADSAGLFFVDTVHLGRYIDLTGGIRYDYFYTQQRQYTASTQLNTFLYRIDKKPSYRAAFVVKPTASGSVYFDYGTSFNPSAEALSLSVSTTVLPPEENETYELGSKWGFLHDRLSLAAAIFQTTKNNAKETSPANSTITVLAGNQRVRGGQVSVTGRLANQFDFIAGYAYLNSEVIASQFYPNAIGAPLANVPKQTFNVWLNRALGLRFTGGLGGNYVASRSASSTIPYVATAWTGTTPANAVVTATRLKQVPGYWAFNGVVQRPITERISLQANINNILNRSFIDEPHPSHLVPGEGRNALFGLNYKF
ncbi:Ferrichrome-iron receptor [Granulicella sibirica]|uniref:Ferrichrome-iron receptor n=1 Tax=Granulicella sibirica TaxID=2479048 RepID=A0A4Q0T9R5_9BACT|nr:Ferrichrome-iron receptor [Granulicella sibirica]